MLKEQCRDWYMVFSQHASFSCSFKEYLIVIVRQYKKINNQKINIKKLCNGTSNLIGSKFTSFLQAFQRRFKIRFIVYLATQHKIRTNIFRDLCVECSWTWKSCLFNPLIHSLSLQKKKERDKRPCNLLMKQSNLSRRTVLWYQQVSVLQCSPFSLFSPFTPNTGIQMSFCKILRNIYSAVSLAE